MFLILSFVKCPLKKIREDFLRGEVDILTGSGVLSSEPLGVLPGDLGGLDILNFTQYYNDNLSK